MFVDESVLTGESDSSEKHTQVSEQNSALGDRHCMVYQAQLLEQGRAQRLLSPQESKRKFTE